MLNLSNEHLTSAEICKFRDEAFNTYHKDESYLSLLQNKFGQAARKDMEDTLSIDLKRRLLGD